MKLRSLFIVTLVFLLTQQLAAQKLPVVIPESVGLNTVHLMNIDRVVHQAIEKQEIPGAVIAIVREGKIGYLKAFGNKQIYPTSHPMDVRTVFDLASCTKPLATAISTFLLLEQGKIRLIDPVSYYLPHFKGYESDSLKQSIQIIDLLTHTSGLPPYAPVSTLAQEEGDSKEVLKAYISNCKRNTPPKTAMQYSCLNYITLQYIIEEVSGVSLQEFTQKNIYAPLKLTHTTFVPNEDLKAASAPTEVQPDGTLLQGVVHDPLARIMNKGISGNAGLFSTAEEVAVLASLFLNQGKANGVQLLSPASIQKMSELPIGLESFGRTPGWDKSSPYASNKGDLFPTAFGHTGYTGTSVVIDPETHTALIVLTNSVHPYDKGKTVRLRSLLANIVASSIGTVNIDNYLSHYAERVEQFQSEKKIGKKDIVLLGNSLTENGGDWGKRFNRKHVRNRGIIGDNTEGVLNRLQEITQGEPKQLILTIGINDLSQGLNLYTLLENTEKIITTVQKESPNTKISLQSLLPINEEKCWYRLMKGKTKTIIAYNAMLRELAEKHQLTFIPAYSLFLEEGTDQLKGSLTRDGLHLNEEGYQIWSEFLKPYLLK